MSNKDYKASDEVDLNYLLGSINKSFKSFLRALFSGYDFVIKRWYIVVLLVISGAVAGYFWQNSMQQNKTAKLLLQVNFDGASYLYNAVSLLQNKIDQGDGEFLASIGLNQEEPELLSLELTPVVRIQDIVSRYDASNDNRSLESVLKNVEFEDEDDFKLSQTFETAYKYHVLEVVLLPSAKKEVLNGLVAYMNGNRAMQEHKTATVNMLQSQLDNNIEILSQIDKLITDLRLAAQNPRSGNAAYIVERDDDLDELIKSKIDLEKENRAVREELLETTEVVVPMTALEIYPAKKSLTDRKIILLPLILVFGFMLTAFFRYSYVQLRAIAYSENV